MRWDRWTESQLRAYLCRSLHREDIMRELESMDDDIWVATSRWGEDGPRGSGGSVVEMQAVARERTRDQLVGQLNRIDQRASLMESAMAMLSPLEFHAVKLTYLSVAYDHDAEIADQLGVDIATFEALKGQALGTLYDNLTAEARKTA